MKLKITRSPIKATLFATVLLATCLLAGSANAQGPFQGKFTLPYKAHWGQAVLPPGDYHLALTVDNAGTEILVIQNVKSLRTVVEPVMIRDGKTKGETALLIGASGGQRIVYSLRIAELGETFVYERPPGGGGAIAVVRQAQVIPVLVAKQ